MSENEEILFIDENDNKDSDNLSQHKEAPFNQPTNNKTQAELKKINPLANAKIKISVKLKFSILTAFLITVITFLISFYLLDNIKTNLLTEMKLRGKLFAENLSKSLSEVFEDDVSRHEIVLKNKTTLKNDIVTISVYNNQKDLVDASDIEQYKKILLSKFDETIQKADWKLDDTILTKLQQNPFYLEEYQKDNEQKFYYFTYIKIANTVLGYLKIDFTKKFVLEEIQNVQLRIILFIIISLFVVIVISYLLTSYLIKPLKNLAQGVQIIGNGDLNYKIKIQTKDELAHLATEFNNMTEKLLKAQKSMIEKERFEEQLEIARKIQENLLPEKFPELKELEISAYYKAAIGVGGDYYDVMYSPTDNKISTIIADVSGKGVPAALVMVMIRTIFYTNFKFIKRTNEAIKNINQGITGRLTGDKFATIFYFSYHIQTGILEFSNAAHSPLLVYRNKSKQIIELDTAGVPVGIDTKAVYEVKATRLSEGDIVITFTDGITEAMDENGNMFRLNPLKELIINNAHLSAEDLKNKIIEQINIFIGEAPQHDDMTLVIFKIKRVPNPQLNPFQQQKSKPAAIHPISEQYIKA